MGTATATETDKKVQSKNEKRQEDLLANIQAIRDEISQHDAASAELRVMLQKISQTTAEASGLTEETPANNGAVRQTSQGRRGRPTGSKNKPKTGERARNEMTLNEAILDVISRKPSFLKANLANYDGNGGCKASEVKELIEKEGKWTSTSGNIGNQISQSLSKMRAANQVKRDDDKRYHAV